MEMQPTITFLSTIARNAGAMLRQMQHEELDVQLKGRANLVTRADKAAEAYIIGEILKGFPNHSIFAEESGSRAGDPDAVWFIDPLDGTTNYAHGLPFFSVSIGFAYRGQLELGVVYDPSLGECFTAQRGQGALLNGKAISVSKASQLSEALLVTGFRTTLIGTPLDNFQNFLHFSKETHGVRRLGSAALNLAYVAAGRLEGYWEVTLSPWDIAAGILLVEEAGGLVTQMYGETLVFTHDTSILAASPRMHAEMLKVLEGERS